MNTTHSRRASLAAACSAALAALTLTATGATAATVGAATAHAGSGGAPIVRTDDGFVRGTAAGAVDEFLGIPSAAPPTGNLRWRPPAPPTAWDGVRDATQFGASCPQPASPFAPPGPFSEDCLFLNVYTPPQGSGNEGSWPVIVWIHGGGLTEDAGRDYDGSKLAADGAIAGPHNRGAAPARMGGRGACRGNSGAGGREGQRGQCRAARGGQRDMPPVGRVHDLDSFCFTGGACHCFAGVAACRGDTPPSEALARCGLVARGGGHAHPSWLLPRRRERGG